MVPTYGNYCGPGHGDPENKEKPVDQLDAVCQLHDTCYQFAGKEECDGAMAEDLAKIDEPDNLWGRLYLSFADKYMDAVGSENPRSLEQIIREASEAKFPDRVIQKALRKEGVSGLEIRQWMPELQELASSLPVIDDVQYHTPLAAEQQQIFDLSVVTSLNNQRQNKKGGKRKGKGRGKPRARRPGRGGNRAVSVPKKALYKRLDHLAAMEKQHGSSVRLRGAQTGIANFARKVETMWSIDKLGGGKAGILLKGTDLIDSISTLGTTQPIPEGAIIFTHNLAPTDPGWNSTRLQQFAPLFQKFKFRKCTYRYAPASPTTITGQILHYVDFDVSTNLNEIQDSFEAAQVAAAKQGAQPFQPFQYRSTSLRPTDDPFQTFYINPAINGNVSDPRLYSQGKYTMITPTGLAAGQAYGLLYVDYQIELWESNLGAPQEAHPGPGEDFASGIDYNVAVGGQGSSGFDMIQWLANFIGTATAPTVWKAQSYAGGGAGPAFYVGNLNEVIMNTWVTSGPDGHMQFLNWPYKTMRIQINIWCYATGLGTGAASAAGGLFVATVSGSNPNLVPNIVSNDVVVTSVSEGGTNVMISSSIFLTGCNAMDFALDQTQLIGSGYTTAVGAIRYAYITISPTPLDSTVMAFEMGDRSCLEKKCALQVRSEQRHTSLRSMHHPSRKKCDKGQHCLWCADQRRERMGKPPQPTEDPRDAFMKFIMREETPRKSVDLEELADFLEGRKDRCKGKEKTSPEAKRRTLKKSCARVSKHVRHSSISSSSSSDDDEDFQHIPEDECEEEHHKHEELRRAEMASHREQKVLLNHLETIEERLEERSKGKELPMFDHQMIMIMIENGLEKQCDRDLLARLFHEKCAICESLKNIACRS